MEIEVSGSLGCPTQLGNTLDRRQPSWLLKLLIVKEKLKLLTLGDCDHYK
jgi:hypothetical protein